MAQISKGKKATKKTTKRTATNHSRRNGEKTKPVYFLSLTVENVRCFGSSAQKLDVSDGAGNPRQWTIILGDNGTGKTTLLQNLISISLDDPPFDHLPNDVKISKLKLLGKDIQFFRGEKGSSKFKLIA